MASSGIEVCPKCGTHFETRPAILDLGQVRGPLNLPSIPPRVSCPACRQTFRAQGIRYFGFITAWQLQIGLTIFILLFALVAFVFLFWQDPGWQGRA